MDSEAGEQDLEERIVAYEEKLRQGGQRPMLAAIFILYFTVSSAVLSLMGYWIFK